MSKQKTISNVEEKVRCMKSGKLKDALKKDLERKKKNTILK